MSQNSADQDEAAANNVLVREAFQILTQGVEMIHYDTKTSRRPTKLLKIVWLESDILRICVDVNRPTQQDRVRGKVPPGIYLRDIGEVRAGSNAYDFMTHPDAPDANRCLSLIGTERTISLELPSEKSCKWFLRRFELVAQDVLNNIERSLRVKITPAKEAGEISHRTLRKLQEQLTNGFSVLHHHPNGRIVPSFLKFDPNSGNNLILERQEKGFLDFARHKIMALHIDDISEIRAGTHSIGFVQTNSLDKQDVCLSIIGTECTFDLQLATPQSRYEFVRHLNVFVQLWKSVGGISEIHLDDV